MQIDRFRLSLRPRSGMEGLDLGFLMMREWSAQLFLILLTVWLPVILVVFGVTWGVAGWPIQWVMLLMWWLKPVFERPLLFALSGAVFDEPVSLSATIRALPNLLRHSGLIGDLLWRRFSWSRSFFLPARQLEGQTGSAGRKRRGILGRQTRSTAWVLGLSLQLFGLIFFIGSMLLVNVFAPTFADGFALKLLFDNTQPVAQAVVGLILLIVDGCMMPAFVACGFALYLQRRTALEGWDIELNFRRLSARLAHLSHTLVLVLICAGVLTFAAPQRSEAATETAASVTPEQAIHEVLSNPQYGHYKAETHLEWQSKPDETVTEKPKAEEKPTGFGDWVESFAGAIRVLMWIAIAVAVLFGLFALARYLGWWQATPITQYEMPEALFGMDVRADTLPTDIPTAARARLAANDPLGALSILYRGALFRWLKAGLKVLPGNTEGDCVVQVSRLAPNRSAYFASLVNLWQRAAYAHQIPATELVAQLCDSWAINQPDPLPERAV